MSKQGEQTAGDSARAAYPVIILLGIVLLAAVLTYVVPSGSYQREGGLVVPGSYQTLPKDYSAQRILAVGGADAERRAGPVGPFAVLLAIPQGIARMSNLIFMVLTVGGMFGVLRHTGAVDAGLDRMIAGVRGNPYVLAPVLMLVFSAGSTFLGLTKEYLLVIPLLVAMCSRLGLSNLVGLAIVAVAVKAGYIASVSNPVPLSIAQPLVGVAVFSGAGFRLLSWATFLAIGIGFVLFAIRRERPAAVIAATVRDVLLSVRQKLVLAALAVGVAVLVFAATHWGWSHVELAAYYIGLSVVLAIAGGIGPAATADAFVRGMQSMLMAAMLIGLAAAVTITLENGQVLDTLVYGLAGLVGESAPLTGAVAMFVAQLSLDVFIPSTSGQAAATMPIMGPLGHLAGVSPQTTVLAFLFGNGITNLLTPTSSALLAYLATAQVTWTQWFSFAWRLWAIYIGTALALLTLAVATGY